MQLILLHISVLNMRVLTNAIALLDPPFKDTPMNKLLNM